MTTASQRVRPRAGREGVAVAFFDVDETVIAGKSMLDFWAYWEAEHPSAAVTGPPPASGPAAAPNREALNRWYYRRYAGVPLAALEAAGRSWYETYRRGGTAFVLPVLDTLAAHRAEGREVVLVSGSMRPLLDPLAAELGVATVLCTELVVRPDGVLTGEVHRPMIGEAKAAAATGIMRERGAHPPDCFAYGDHESDLALLRAVGRPVVVGSSAVLNEEARRHGWPLVPAHYGPLGTEVP
ncbi:HAD-IB family hydrolase [Streptomyces sp. NPDC001941]|uniref:HAD family hydrolase n=1 Tax=Streptomyces sp. NPDC001941 TaxID=3154659 RepID=UPI00332158B2